ncbi:unnamed protein product [Caenorhabditis angaria]|uniref:Uncharacterized protein n=1 Tax=Caenorhabditis angaria TaxID=860376 RepID=A0A9P1MX50_9PELO|nr:unnamed protein product [Caenorhabditis angaria]
MIPVKTILKFFEKKKEEFVNWIFGASIGSAFAAPFHRRAFVSEVYSDTNQGKVKYGNIRFAQGDCTFVVDVAFKCARQNHSNIKNVFPKFAIQLEVEGFGGIAIHCVCSSALSLNHSQTTNYVFSQTTNYIQ